MNTFKDYVLVTLACLLFLLLTEPIRADDNIKKATKDLTKYYGKQYLDTLNIDFNNDYIKYGGGIIKTVSDKELDIKLGNTKIKLSEDNLLITFKKEF